MEQLHTLNHTGRCSPAATGCRSCDDLLEECGPDLFPMYSKKLLVRGWPGRVSPVERGYIRAHRSDAASKQAQHRAAHLREVRAKAQKSNTQLAEGAKPDLDAPLSTESRAATVEGGAA